MLKVGLLPILISVTNNLSKQRFKTVFIQVWSWTIHWVGITKADNITYKHIQMQTLRPHHIYSIRTCILIEWFICT